MSVIIDSLGRVWRSIHHPRDRKGRFIRTGGAIRAFLRQESSKPDFVGNILSVDEDGTARVQVTGGRGDWAKAINQIAKVKTDQLEMAEYKARIGQSPARPLSEKKRAEVNDLLKSVNLSPVRDTSNPYDQITDLETAADNAEKADLPEVRDNLLELEDYVRNDSVPTDQVKAVIDDTKGRTDTDATDSSSQSGGDSPVVRTPDSTDSPAPAEPAEQSTPQPLPRTRTRTTEPVEEGKQSVADYEQELEHLKDAYEIADNRARLTPARRPSHFSGEDRYGPERSLRSAQDAAARATREAQEALDNLRVARDTGTQAEYNQAERRLSKALNQAHNKNSNLRTVTKQVAPQTPSEAMGTLIRGLFSDVAQATFNAISKHMRKRKSFKTDISESELSQNISEAVDAAEKAGDQLGAVIDVRTGEIHVGIVSTVPEDVPEVDSPAYQAIHGLLDTTDSETAPDVLEAWDHMLNGRTAEAERVFSETIAPTLPDEQAGAIRDAFKAKVQPAMVPAGLPEGWERLDTRDYVNSITTAQAREILREADFQGNDQQALAVLRAELFGKMRTPKAVYRSKNVDLVANVRITPQQRASIMRSAEQVFAADPLPDGHRLTVVATDIRQQDANRATAARFGDAAPGGSHIRLNVPMINAYSSDGGNKDIPDGYFVDATTNDRTFQGFAKAMLTHEYGHVRGPVREEQLTDQQQRILQATPNASQHTTQYMNQDPFEFYAENYAEWMQTQGNTTNPVTQAWARINNFSPDVAQEEKASLAVPSAFEDVPDPRTPHFLTPEDASDTATVFSKIDENFGTHLSQAFAYQDESSPYLSRVSSQSLLRDTFNGAPEQDMNRNDYALTRDAVQAETPDYQAEQELAEARRAILAEIGIDDPRLLDMANGASAPQDKEIAQHAFLYQMQSEHNVDATSTVHPEILATYNPDTERDAAQLARLTGTSDSYSVNRWDRFSRYGDVSPEAQSYLDRHRTREDVIEAPELTPPDEVQPPTTPIETPRLFTDNPQFREMYEQIRGRTRVAKRGVGNVHLADRVALDKNGKVVHKGDFVHVDAAANQGRRGQDGAKRPAIDAFIKNIAYKMRNGRPILDENGDPVVQRVQVRHFDQAYIGRNHANPKLQAAGIEWPFPYWDYYVAPQALTRLNEESDRAKRIFDEFGFHGRRMAGRNAGRFAPAMGKVLQMERMWNIEPIQNRMLPDANGRLIGEGDVVRWDGHLYEVVRPYNPWDRKWNPRVVLRPEGGGKSRFVAASSVEYHDDPKNLQWLRGAGGLIAPRKQDVAETLSQRGLDTPELTAVYENGSDEDFIRALHADPQVQAFLAQEQENRVRIRDRIEAQNRGGNMTDAPVTYHEYEAAQRDKGDAVILTAALRGWLISPDAQGKPRRLDRRIQKSIFDDYIGAELDIPLRAAYGELQKIIEDRAVRGDVHNPQANTFDIYREFTNAGQMWLNIPHQREAALQNIERIYDILPEEDKPAAQKLIQAITEWGDDFDRRHAALRAGTPADDVPDDVPDEPTTPEVTTPSVPTPEPAPDTATPDLPTDVQSPRAVAQKNVFDQADKAAKEARADGRRGDARGIQNTADDVADFLDEARDAESATDRAAAFANAREAANAADKYGLGDAFRAEIDRVEQTYAQTTKSEAVASLRSRIDTMFEAAEESIYANGRDAKARRDARSLRDLDGRFSDELEVLQQLVDDPATSSQDLADQIEKVNTIAQEINDDFSDHMPGVAEAVSSALSTLQSSTTESPVPPEVAAFANLLDANISATNKFDYDLATDLDNMLSDGRIQDLSIISSGSLNGDVFRVLTNDGASLIVKTDLEPESHRSEVAVSSLYRALGFTVPAVTSLPNHDGVLVMNDFHTLGVKDINEGMSYAWSQQFIQLDDLDKEQAFLNEMLHGLVANVVVGNQDRHGLNIAFGIDANDNLRPVFFDHGITMFTARGKFSGMSNIPSTDAQFLPLKTTPDMYVQNYGLGNVNYARRVLRYIGHDQKIPYYTTPSAMEAVAKFAERIRDLSDRLADLTPQERKFIHDRAGWVLENVEKIINEI